MYSKNVRLVFIGWVAAAIVMPNAAIAEPTVTELYEMLQAQQRMLESQRSRIEQLEGAQQRLQTEADAARNDAAAARAEATSAQEDLAQAQARIDSMQADVAALPEVAALPDVAAGDDPVAPTGVFMGLEALYWTLDSGSEYEYVVVQDGGAIGSGDVRGDVKNVEWDWDGGFRGEIGYRFDIGVDALLRGVTFDTSGDDSERDPDGNMTALALLHDEDDFDETDTSFAEVDMDVDFTMIDFESGKWFSIGDGFALRPFATLRYADFEYDLDSRFCTDIACDLGGEVETADSSVDWWGFGVLGGMEGRWDFLDRFSIFGRGAAGVIGGEYDARATYTDVDDGAQFTRTEDDGDLWVPVLEASLGLGVQLWDADGISIGFEAGYEALSFFDSPQPFGQTPDDIDQPTYFDEETMTLHGAFFRLGVGF